MANVTYLYDGFNVYHSIRAALRYSDYDSLKWLNLRSLSESFLSALGQEFGERVELDRVYYFSAPAKHRLSHDPGVVGRHMTYVAALESVGVLVDMSRFKRKRVWCKECGEYFTRHEEKETDVAIGSRLIERAIRGRSEIIALVCGDTDMLPAIRIAKSMRPDRRIWTIFPFRRHNSELDKVADGTFSLDPDHYHDHQFPAEVEIGDGKAVYRPPSW